MRFSKEIKYYLLFLAAILPVFLIDQSVTLWFREFRNANPDITQILKYIDRAAYYAAHGTPLIGGALLIYLFGRYYDRQWTMQFGRTLLIGFISAGVSVQVIKHILGRARPRITDQLLFIGPAFRGSYDSFPSGHAAMAFCLAYICSGYFPRYRALFYLYGLFVCFGRVDSASHFPADVLGGALLGVIVARIIEKRFGMQGTEKPAFRRKTEHAE